MDTRNIDRLMTDSREKLTSDPPLFALLESGKSLAKVKEELAKNPRNMPTGMITKIYLFRDKKKMLGWPDEKIRRAIKKKFNIREIH